MADAAVRIENHNGLVDFGACPDCDDARLIRKNHATGWFQCENGRHEVPEPRKEA